MDQALRSAREALERLRAVLASPGFATADNVGAPAAPTAMPPPPGATGESHVQPRR